MEDGTLGVTKYNRFITPAGVQFNMDCDGSDEDAISEQTEEQENSFFEF
jgi:hypothetical protein